MSLLKGISFLFILALAIGFALYNEQPISLRYYFGWESISLPLFLWAFLALILGLIGGGIYALGAKISLRARLRQMKKTIEQLERKRMAAAKDG